MRQYLDLLQHLIHTGNLRRGRNGATGSVFGAQMAFNLEEGFPIVTTRPIFFKGVVSEGLWFLSGSTNLRDLPAYLHKWWQPWADENGELGPIYGSQWRNSTWVDPSTGRIYAKDQFADLLWNLQYDPFSRRHVVNLWHSPAMDTAKLPCCHGSVIQFYVAENKGIKTLSCQVYSRSADIILGLPVNIAWYALLTHMMAKYLGYAVGDLIWSGGDLHIYEQHIINAIKLCEREPQALPTLVINEDFNNVATCPNYFQYLPVEFFKLEGYNPLPHLEFELVV